MSQDPIYDCVSVELELVSANTSYRIPTTTLTNKKLFVVYNKSDATIYYGGHNVTVDIGIPLEPGKMFSLRASGLYFICPQPGKKINIVILELQ